MKHVLLGVVAVVLTWASKTMSPPVRAVLATVPEPNVTGEPQEVPTADAVEVFENPLAVVSSWLFVLDRPPVSPV